MGLPMKGIDNKFVRTQKFTNGIMSSRLCGFWVSHVLELTWTISRYYLCVLKSMIKKWQPKYCAYFSVVFFYSTSADWQLCERTACGSLQQVLQSNVFFSTHKHAKPYGFRPCNENLTPISPKSWSGCLEPMRNNFPQTSYFSFNQF